ARGILSRQSEGSFEGDRRVRPNGIGAKLRCGGLLPNRVIPIRRPLRFAHIFDEQTGFSTWADTPSLTSFKSGAVVALGMLNANSHFTYFPYHLLPQRLEMRELQTIRFRDPNAIALCFGIESA